MKTLAVERFRHKLQDDQLLVGLWITLEAHAVADIAAGFAIDWIVIDVHAGRPEWATLREYVRATHRSNTVALIRLRDGSPECIGWALEAGVDGFLIPPSFLLSELDSALDEASAASHLAQTGGHPSWLRYSDSAFSSSQCRPLIFTELTSNASPCGEILQSASIDAILLPSAKAAPGALQDSVYANQVALIRSSGRRPAAVVHDDTNISLFLEHGVKLICLGIDHAIIFQEASRSLAVAEDCSTMLAHNLSHRRPFPPVEETAR